MKVKSLSHVQLSVTPWTAAYQAPLSMGFSRQEYWSGVPLPSPKASGGDGIPMQDLILSSNDQCISLFILINVLMLLLLLLLSCFSRVRLCVTPETAAHQALLSLGFSRQEHWSGLPFLSPMHESEK